MKLGNVVLGLLIWVMGALVTVFFGLPVAASDGGFTMIIPLLIAFILGLIVIIKGREKQLAPIQSLVSKSIRYCPKCSREIPFDSTVCPYCQNDFK
jgi:hypothetical protein